MRYPPRRARGICRRTLGMGRSAGQTDPIAPASGKSRDVSDTILFPVAKEPAACQIDSVTESQRCEWRLSASRKNHAEAEATSSLRVRRLLNRRCASKDL